MNLALKEETFEIERDGRKLPVFAVGPDDAAMLPGLIVIHEIFGVNDHIRDVARRFAGNSLRVFAPDLFAVSDKYPQDPAQRDDLATMREVWSSIPDSQLMTDLQTVFNKVASYKGVIAESVGCIGYCMGGAIALMFACTEPRLAWVIDYYGRIKYGATSKEKPRHPIEYTANLKCPMFGIFAGVDELITAADRAELAAKLEQHQKPFKMKVYETAQHAFFNDRRPHFDKAAAEDALQLTLDFIKVNSKRARPV
jgi:carboxymethylenebutenolidase